MSDPVADGLRFVREQHDRYRKALKEIGMGCPHRQPCDCAVTIALNALNDRAAPPGANQGERE